MKIYISASEIIKSFLADNGMDGLCSPDMDCSCFIGDLFPCDCPCDRCLAGVAISCDDDGNIKNNGKFKTIVPIDIVNNKGDCNENDWN